MRNADSRFFYGGYDGGRCRVYPRDWYTLDSRVVLLKGGAGTGKSTLMRAVLAQWQRQGRETAAFFCGSDPASLDAVCTADRTRCVLDATAPHAVEARFPAAVERIVDLGSGLSRPLLRERLPELAVSAEEQRALRQSAGEKLRIAAETARRECALTGEGVSAALLTRCAARLSGQLFGRERGREGERRAYLSGVTPDGMLCLYETMTALCPRIFVLEGAAGAAQRLMQLLRQRAAQAGLLTVACPCALRPECIEHLLLPAVGAAVTTSGPFHSVDFPVYRRLYLPRYRTEPLSAAARHERERLTAVRGQLCTEAAAFLRAARQRHQREEELYGSAMDWAVADALTEEVCRFLA